VLRLPFALLVVAACARDEATPSRTASHVPLTPLAADLVDDFGDTVRLRSAGAPPVRIVSLNPTTTEALFALGAGGRVVGRTTWDHWPTAAKAVPDLGPGIRPNVEAILGAHPDLVLLYASADNRSAAARLRAAGIVTASFKVDRVADFRRMMRGLGLLLGDTMKARTVADSVDATLRRVRQATAGRPRVSVFLRFWERPLLTVGRGSYISELLEAAGGRNVFDSLAAPSPQVTFESVVRADPDVVLAGPDAREKLLADPAWRALRAVRERRVLAYDTAVVLRPSVRMGEGARSLARLLHPAAGL